MSSDPSREDVAHGTSAAGDQTVAGEPHDSAAVQAGLRETPALSPLRTGLRGRCPRCGDGRLFRGFLALAPRCEVCGLDYSFADPADGPAFFVLCFACVPAVFLALWIDAAFAAPVWVHLVTSLPFLLATCILPLRPLKGWLVCSQYVYKAEEGRLQREP